MNKSDQPDIEAAELIAARQGDENAFESLVHRYEKRVFALSLRMCRNPEDAREAAQEAFLSAWQGLSSFRGDSGFSTWLYRLAYNACIDLIRREKRQHTAPLSFEDYAEHSLNLPDPQDRPAEALEKKELRRTVEKGIRSLSPEYRTVLILRELQQLSYQEIADTLELDLGTVKSRINRGRKQLQKFLRESGNFSPRSLAQRDRKEG